jgi:hypothetical protein
MQVIISLPFISTLAILAVVIYLHCKRSFRPPLPKNLPWIGVKEGQWFATFRAHRREWKEGIEMLKEGYSKVTLSGLHLVAC